MLTGKKIRMAKITGIDGRAMLVAADHGQMLGPIKGVRRLGDTLEKVVEGGADGILVSPGQAARLNHLFHGKNAPAMLIRADYVNAFRTLTYTLPIKEIHHFQTISPQEALKLGASAIVTYYLIGRHDQIGNDEASNLETLAKMGRECEKIGLPFIIEPLPLGSRVTGSNFTRLLASSVRISEELGADAIKTLYSGDIRSFRKICNSVSIPIFVLGGAKGKTMREGLELVEEAIEAGAKGTVFGRQVVQAEDPTAMVSAICKVVHDRVPVRNLVNPPVQEPAYLRILPQLCTGCYSCVMACSFKQTGNYSESNATINIIREFPSTFKPQTCTSCGKCIEACAEKALSFSDITHQIILDKGKCTNCDACVSACPFNIIKTNPAIGHPLICDFCNGQPECVEWCPTDAIMLEPLKKSGEKT